MTRESFFTYDSYNGLISIPLDHLKARGFTVEFKNPSLKKDMEHRMIRIKGGTFYKNSEAISAIEDRGINESEIGGTELKYFKSRQYIHLWRKFESARKRIKILTTDLITVYANYIDSIVLAIEKYPGIEVKILTSDPENNFIGPLAGQLGEDETGYRMELQGSLQSILAKLQKYSNCEIKTYTDFPVQLWHLVDDYLYVGQFSLIRRTRHNCVYGINVLVEGVKETYLDHFERLWASSSSPKTKVLY